MDRGRFYKKLRASEKGGREQDCLGCSLISTEN